MKIILSVIFFSFFLGLTNDCSPSKPASIEQASQPVVSATTSATPNSKNPPTVQNSKTELWQGTSGNFDISWTKENIVAKNSSGAKVFSVRQFALTRLKNSANSEYNFENFTFQYKILAVVGSYLFLQETTSYSPQSYTNESYTAIDLANPQAKIDLKKFYGEAEILAALNKNLQIIEDFKINEIDEPKTFKEFFAAYDREPSEIAEREIDRCYFPKNVFESFYFDRVENDKIVVDLGIPCRAEMREETVFPLKLLLPLKPAIESDLKTADAQNTLKSAAKDAETVIQFDAKLLKNSK